MRRKVFSALLLSVGISLSGLSVSGNEVPLTGSGGAAARIVVSGDAPSPVRFGAQELVKYLGIVSGGAVLEIHGEPSRNLNNLFIGTRADRELVKASGIDPSNLKDEGFALSVRPRAVYIVGADPRGALYGAYEILKKYAGIRWLVPGPDGEYCPRKAAISVPFQKSIHNPYLRIRNMSYGSEIHILTWMVRNNMMPAWSQAAFVNPRTGQRTKQADHLDELTVRGSSTSGNSHILTNLVGGWDHRTLEENLKKLYAVHPEYFPLIDGKRVMIKGAHSPNPCISNPALLDLMAENLYARIKGKYGADIYVTIGNNDTTSWCECENCRRLDNPAKQGTKGARSDRYWYMVNEIARRVWKKDPSLKLGGWAYQDFWYPPTKVRIDPRLRILISFNNQCWRHSIQDSKCSVNRELCRIMGEWKKTKLPVIVNRDEISTTGSVGSCYLPSERVLYENFRQYPALGFSGTNFCVPSPFPVFQRWYKNTPPYYGRNLRWYGMWQTCYLSAQFMWDINQDFDQLYEEANWLYYGKAWDNGFKEFKQLQTRYFRETPGCIGWGQGAPLGRCLDQAGSEQKLKSLMDQAVNAARQSGDQRALAHILRDKQIFEITWLHSRKEYLVNFKELNVYHRQGPVKIDGMLDEGDWKKADVVSNFKAGGHTPAGTRVEQSYVRVLYDPDNLYIAVECMEPHPEKIIAGRNISPGPEGWKGLGNSVELFYNYPDMGDQYYHLAINSNGGHVDARQLATATRDTTFRTRAQVATKILKDRWILEIRIPTSEIGMKCYTGSTWRLNVGRQRKLDGMKNETSSCCNGHFHGAANFIHMKFNAKRAGGIYQNADRSAWKNGSFDVSIPDAERPRYYRWSRAEGWEFPDAQKLTARYWDLSKDARGSYRLREDSDRNYYVRLQQGHMSQYYISDDPGVIRIQFKARGSGAAALWTASYCNHDNPKILGYRFLKGSSKNNIFRLTPEWKTYTFETRKVGVKTERTTIRFTPGKNCTLDLDDCLVYPAGAEQ